MSDVTGQVKGLRELLAKSHAMQLAFDGRPLEQLAKAAGKPIADQAKRNARRGPTGAVIRGVNVFDGKKAGKFGAAAVVKVAWKYSGAIFEEWGTKERVFHTMRIPLSKLGAATETMGSTMRAYGAGGSFSRLSGASFGLIFARTAAPMQGTQFFERAVAEKADEALQIFTDGCGEIIAGAMF